MKDKDGRPPRAYVKPEIWPGLGSIGTEVKPDRPIDANVIILNLLTYFLDVERVYRGSGLVVAALPKQRFFQLEENTPATTVRPGRIGNLACSTGADETLYFYPYVVDSWSEQKTYLYTQEGSEAVSQLLENGVIY